MSETNGNTPRDTGKRWFSNLYRTRVKVQKDDVPVMNVSLGFTAIGVLCAPWLAVGGAAAALAMGYRFSVERDAKGFSGDFQQVVQEAAGNVRAAVDSVTRSAESQPEGDEGADDSHDEE